MCIRPCTSIMGWIKPLQCKVLTACTGTAFDTPVGVPSQPMFHSQPVTSTVQTTPRRFLTPAPAASPCGQVHHSSSSCMHALPCNQIQRI